MDDSAAFASGKGHHDENFPVASLLIRRRYRPAIFAFYRFARSADDIADNASAPPERKLAALAAMGSTLLGKDNADRAAIQLRGVLHERGLPRRHALDLLEAFTRDVTKKRYRDWDDLMDYCSYSAAPVGRFVLDVHGESYATWPASDALCAALQVINHLQDCGRDFVNLDRVYIPLDAFEAAGLTPSVLGERRAPPQLRALLARLAERCDELLKRGRPLASQVRDRRLALEISVIQRLAESLVRRLTRRDPLSERVHHRPWEVIGLSALAVFRR